MLVLSLVNLARFAMVIAKFDLTFMYIIVDSVTHDSIMSKKVLTYIYLEEGEYLYDSATRRVYTKCAPHKWIGNIDVNTCQIQFR